VPDRRADALLAAHDNPRLAVLADADSECRSVFVEGGAGRMQAQHH
jgi:hypothetical protein